MPQSEGASAAGPEPVATAPKGRPAKRIALVLVALLIAALVVPLLVEVRIPMNWLRDRVEAQVNASDAVQGLELKLRGPLLIVTGLAPGLEAHDVAFEVPSASGSVEFARIGAVHVGIALRALMSREVRMTRAVASDLVLRMDGATRAAISAALRSSCTGCQTSCLSPAPPERPAARARLLHRPHPILPRIRAFPRRSPAVPRP